MNKFLTLTLFFLGAFMNNTNAKSLLIAYDTQTKNTELLAKEIEKGAKMFKDIKVISKNINEIQPIDLIHYDAYIFGSPNYYGNISSNTLSFFEEGISLWKEKSLIGKKAAIFMTGGSGQGIREAKESLERILQSFGLIIENHFAESLNGQISIVEKMAANKLGYLMAKELSFEEKDFIFDDDLPNAPKPVGHYRPFIISQNRVYINQVALEKGTIKYPGVIAKDVTVEEAKEMTIQTMKNVLAVLKEAVDGDLTRVKQVVELTGFFLTDTDFEDHASILNSASDLVFDYFGEKGYHARAAVGASSLPLRSPVEIKAIFEIE